MSKWLYGEIGGYYVITASLANQNMVLDGDQIFIRFIS
jgi:hypothetical protein